VASGTSWHTTASEMAQVKTPCCIRFPQVGDENIRKMVSNVVKVSNGTTTTIAVKAMDGSVGVGSERSGPVRLWKHERPHFDRFVSGLGARVPLPLNIAQASRRDMPISVVPCDRVNFLSQFTANPTTGFVGTMQSNNLAKATDQRGHDAPVEPAPALIG